jgi:hypothetical protein
MNAPDDELLARLWPVPNELAERVAYLRDKHLALFDEPRASWIGRNIRDIFPAATSERCVGEIEKTKPSGDFARAQGWAWAPGPGESPDYILFTDAGGRIIGHGRGGLRHGYIPGLLVELATVPSSHAKLSHSEWLAYFAGTDTARVRLYGAFPARNRVCVVDLPAL